MTLHHGFNKNDEGWEQADIHKDSKPDRLATREERDNRLAQTKDLQVRVEDALASVWDALQTADIEDIPAIAEHLIREAFYPSTLIKDLVGKTLPK